MLKKATSIEQLKGGEVLGVELDGRQFAFYLVSGEPLATTDVCPHAACLLSEDGVVEGEDVECACHGSRFRIRTGENITPPATEPLEVYTVELHGEEVFIDI